jgi:hypothetical protein
VATDDLPGLGIGTASDPLNRLTVAAGTLFTHDGAGHWIAVNKASAGDTAVLLFETGITASGSCLCRADGVQICWTLADFGTIWAFPANFAGTAADRQVQVTMVGNSPYVASVGTNFAKSCVPRVFDLSGTEVTKALYLMAIGRWY